MVMNVGNVLSAYKNAESKGMSLENTSMEVKNKDNNFSDVLEGFVSDSIESIKKGEEMAAKGAVGKADMQNVILAVSEAEVMMHAMVAIRDKVITAYQEITRTAI